MICPVLKSFVSQYCPEWTLSRESVRAKYGSFLACVHKIPSHWYKDMWKRDDEHLNVSSQGRPCVLRKWPALVRDQNSLN